MNKIVPNKVSVALSSIKEPIKVGDPIVQQASGPGSPKLNTE